MPKTMRWPAAAAERSMWATVCSSRCSTPGYRFDSVLIRCPALVRRPEGLPSEGTRYGEESAAVNWDSVLPMMTVFAMLVGSVWTMTKLFAPPLERHLNQLDRRIDRLEGRMNEGFAQIREDIRALGMPPAP